MFDSLKEKLGAFKDEAEEAAEQQDIEEEATPDAEEPAGGQRSASGEGQPPAADDSPGGADPAADTGDGEVHAEVVPEDGSAETATDAGPGRDSGEAGGATAAESGAAPEAGSGAAPEAESGAPAEADSAAGSGEEAAFHAEIVPESEADEEDEAWEDADVDPLAPDRDTGISRKAKSMATGRVVIDEEDLEDPLWELEMALLESDVEMNVAEEILDNLRERLAGETRTFTQSTTGLVEYALRESLLDVISVGQFDFDQRVREADKPVVIVFTGVNGVGKTTTIAKMARYFDDRGLSAVLANGDTYRAGANEQIEEHADRLGEKLITHQQGGDPAAVIYDAVEYAEANDVDVVLGDTAGRLHTDEDLMDQLEKIDRVVDPDMTLFVDEAVAGQDAVRRAREFNDAAEIEGAVLTKADADAQGGAAISIAHVTGKPILFLGTGQGYEDLVRFDPEWMVDQLLGEG